MSQALSGLTDIEIDSARDTIETLKSLSGLDIYFKNTARELDDSANSKIFFVTLPHERSALSPESVSILTDFFSQGGNNTSVTTLLYNMYSKEYSFSLTTAQTVDEKIASLFILRLPRGNTLMDEAVERGVLQSIGYNKDSNVIPNTIFSPENKILTSIDIEVIKILYKNNRGFSISFPEALAKVK